MLLKNTCNSKFAYIRKRANVEYFGQHLKLKLVSSRFRELFHHKNYHCIIVVFSRAILSLSEIGWFIAWLRRENYARLKHSNTTLSIQLFEIRYRDLHENTECSLQIRLPFPYSSAITKFKAGLQIKFCAIISQIYHFTAELHKGDCAPLRHVTSFLFCSFLDRKI